MKKFYTFVGEMDNAIFQRYYNEDKQEVFEKVENYDYTLYVNHPTDISRFTSLDNKSLKEITFDNPRDLKKFYNENKDLMTIHGNNSAVHQFISKEYDPDVQQFCNVKVLNFDIEVVHGDGIKYADNHIVRTEKSDAITFSNVGELKKLPKTVTGDLSVYDEEKDKWVKYFNSCYAPRAIGFPDPLEAEQEILSISAKEFGDDKIFYTFGTKDLPDYDNPNGEYVKCKNEQELLARFMKFWRGINPQFITGWNIDGFDIPYLINRIKKVLGSKYASYLSPFYDKVRNNDKLINERMVDETITYEIFGVTSFDYIELYKKYNYSKQESYKLDYIGEVEVGQKKVNFDEYNKSLMRLYNGDLILDNTTSWHAIDDIMRYARVREKVKVKLAEYGYFTDLGNDVNKVDIKTFDQTKIDEMSNDQLKGLYNYTDERVKTLSYKKFVNYNEMDANIVELIDKKMLFIKLAIRVGHMSKSRMKEIFATVSPWDNMIYSRLLQVNKQIPPRESHEKSEKFLGAYVKDPILGYHKWVATVDLTSLYPSIIRMLNMSPETLRKIKDFDAVKTLEDLFNGTYSTDASKANGWATAANGSAYDQDFEGVIPGAMKYLMVERKLVKNKMKDVENYMQHVKRSIKHRKGELDDWTQTEDYIKSIKRNGENFLTDDAIMALSIKETEALIVELEDEIAMLDSTQLALKILANSGYGAIGNVAFRYFRLDIAEGITLTGQLALRFMSKVLDDFLNAVCGTKDVCYAIYGDTDSIFISLDNWVKHMGLDETNKDAVISAMDEYMAKTIEPLIADNYDKLSDYLGAKENLLIMKREALADAAIFRGKKNYIMQLYDNEHVRFAVPKMKMMGVETAKSSTAMIIRKKLEECFRVVINKDTRTALELKGIVDEFRDEFNTVDVVKIASPRGVNDIDKWIDPQGNIIKGCPIHVRASINYNNFIKADPDLRSKYEEIKNGSKIRFIKLKEPNIVHSHVIAFIDDLPPEMELENFIDRKTQFEDTFMSPLESFTQLIDWDIRRTSSLSSLFGDDDCEPVQQIEALEVTKPKKVVQKRRKTLDDLF